VLFILTGPFMCFSCGLCGVLSFAKSHVKLGTAVSAIVFTVEVRIATFQWTGRFLVSISYKTCCIDDGVCPSVVALVVPQEFM
jgi:hypothetical protein